MNTRPAAYGPAVAAALMLLATLALTPAPAWADCTASGTTATCTGSDLGPISYTKADAVDEIVVEDLTGDVSGSDGMAISLTEAGDDGSGDSDDGEGALPATVTFAGTNGSDTYGISGATDTSVTVTSTGGAGHSGAEQETDHNPEGGDGGNGAAGNDVSFTMTGGFVSQGAGDSGIVVSSTGGAGGQGGEARAENNDSDETTATGGDGGTGALAGTATLTLSDLSNPDGSDGIDFSGVATGISVASTGGAGGQGGEAFCNQSISTRTCKGYTGIGGDAAAAGDATATVTDTDISITDFSATGIEVLSAGGTGGKGGTAKQAGGSYGLIENFPGVNDYGEGGAGGAAAAVSLEFDGSVVEITDDSSQATYGINVLSAGGDGGDGNDNVGEDGGGHPGFGDGGDGANGSAATLTLTGSKIAATVSADDAVAVRVASTGGDGGSIGELEETNSDEWNSDAADGMTGGAGGDAGAVSATMDTTSTLDVTTTGAGGSMGAFTLLSQGGDGGKGGSGGLYGDGDGGAGGTGGRVTGNMTTILAKTSGDDAYGILLKSLGGDGGTGKSIDGSGGDSDPIDVSISAATVTTTGKGSHGVYAISQGGDGGDSSNSGNGGNGDFVTLHVTGGTINVSGENAYGIAAMSLAGSAGSGSDGATAGDVKLITGASVTASGSGGIGLYAESTGGTTNGTIDVTVDSGGTITASGNATAAISIVDGDANTLTNNGTINASGNATAAISFVNGNSNTLTNNGTITASGNATAAISFVNGDSYTLTNNGTITTGDLSTSSIYALSSSGAALAVTNNGTFSGPVDFDSSYANSFANGSGATLNLTTTFDLGTTGTLTNDGTISPGGSGSVTTSKITGSFEQGSDGTYLVDLNGSSTDELVFATGDVTLDGGVTVNIDSASVADGSSAIAVSEAGSITSGLAVTNTATASYTVTQETSDSVTLAWHFSFSDDDLLGSASSNQTSIANHLQQIVESGAGALGKELSSLLNIVSVEDYLAALDTFASQVSSDGELTALHSGQNFADALLSCAQYEGAYRFVSQDQCAWLKFGVIRTEREANSANRPFDQRAAQFAGGAQLQVAEDWHVGGGFSVEDQKLTVDDIAESKGTFYQGGLVTKRSFGNTILSASLSGGYGEFDITRTLASMDIANGTEPLWTVSGQLSASHAFVLGGDGSDWYLKPRVDLAVDHVVMEAYTESGAGGASLTFEKSAETYVSVQPALEVGGEIDAGNGLKIRPSLSVGVTRFLTDAAPSATASFADTPAGVAPFTITSQFDKTYVDVKGGVDLLTKGPFTASLQAFGQFSENTTSYGGSAKLAYRF